MTNPDASSAIGVARVRAARVLERVWVDHAFAAAVLDSELSDLDPRDAALATELVYGVLRTESFLEAELLEFARSGRLVDSAPALAHLLMGAYTMAFLDRIPAFAAVSAAVAGVTAAIGKQPGGFCNAVLRAYARKLETTGRPSPEKAALESAPGWLRGALRRSLGRKGAEQFLSARPDTDDRPGPVAPPLGIAVGDRTARDSVLAKLAAAAPEGTFVASALSAHGIVARGVGSPSRLPGFEREWIVQEEGAQVIALACGAKPGDNVLDACGGRGNKAWLLSHLVGDTGSVILADKFPDKVERWLARAPFPGRTTGVAIDWSVGTGGLARDRDLVLVDAPCSGIGTLRRRPEIARNRDGTELAELAAQQIAITRRAATLCKPGGRLVYAVCSVLAEECEQVVAALTAEGEGPRLTPLAFTGSEIAAIADAPEPTSFRLLPHRHGTDGYFVAQLRVE
ncbi:MAG: Sun protein [Myxococcales bacterium]|nr:Sun protein [Myxococcales bacterium]